MEVDQTLLAEICALLAGAKVLLEQGEINRAKAVVDGCYQELNKLLASIPD